MCEGSGLFFMAAVVFQRFELNGKRVHPAAVRVAPHPFPRGKACQKVRDCFRFRGIIFPIIIYTHSEHLFCYLPELRIREDIER